MATRSFAQDEGKENNLVATRSLQISGQVKNNLVAARSCPLFIVLTIFSSMQYWSLYSTVQQNPWGRIGVQQGLWKCGC